MGAFRPSGVRAFRLYRGSRSSSARVDILRMFRLAACPAVRAASVVEPTTLICLFIDHVIGRCEDSIIVPVMLLLM